VGLLAGYLAGGRVKSGRWHALLAAVGVALLNVAFVVPILWDLPDTEPASTFAVGGFLWLVVFVPFWCVECVLGGGAVGAVRWARDR
jgi:riboflavin transporter FmnP